MSEGILDRWKLREKRGHRRRWGLYPPGWPCPAWINRKVNVRRDWFVGFVAAYRNPDGKVSCWPIGLGRHFWVVHGHGDNGPRVEIHGAPTVWYGTYWIFTR